MSKDDDFRLQRYHDAEHPMHTAIALLEVLGTLIQVRFTSLADVNLETLNMLANQYDAAMPHLREAVETLYGPEEKQYVRLEAEAEPSAAYRCGYAAGIRDGGNCTPLDPNPK